MFSRRSGRYDSSGRPLKRIRKKNFIILALLTMTTYALYRAISGETENNSTPPTIEKIRRDFDQHMKVINGAREQMGTKGDRQKFIEDRELSSKQRKERKKLKASVNETQERKSKYNSKHDDEHQLNVINDDQKPGQPVQIELGVKQQKNRNINVSKETIEKGRSGGVIKQQPSKTALGEREVPQKDSNFTVSNDANDSASNAERINVRKYKYSMNETKNNYAPPDRHRANETTNESLHERARRYKGHLLPRQHPPTRFELMSTLNSSRSDAVPNTKYISFYEDDRVDTKDECVDLKVRGGDKQNKTKICIHNTTEDTFVSGSIKTSGTWEQGDIDEMGAILRSQQEMTLIDTGCNIGSYSLYAATVGNRVIAIDPFKNQLKLLHKSLQLNNLQHAVTILWNAVSKDHRLVKLSQSQENNKGSINIKFENPPRNISSYSVQTIKLDDLVDKFQLRNKRVFLKMDIEGLEYNALVGGVNFFRHVNVCYVLMEFVTYKTKGGEGEEILKFMKHFGLYPYGDLKLKERLDLAGKPLRNYPLNTVFAKDTPECRESK